MKSLRRAEIEAALDEAEASCRVSRAFAALSRERVQFGAVGYLEFQAAGHCHTKSAHIDGERLYVVKIVNGFPANKKNGMAPGQDMIALFDAITGEPCGLLLDEGRLTELRTSMTGAIAAKLLCGAGPQTLGVIGSGVQAELQIRFIRDHLDITELFLWARNAERGAALARRTGAQFVSRDELCARSDLIVTTTSPTEPVLRDAWIRPGARIIAVGSDSVGKRELEPDTVARARVIVESPTQCIAEGETGGAIRAGLMTEDLFFEFVALIDRTQAFGTEEIVIVDLAGTAVQDHAIAPTVWDALTAANLCSEAA